jgi:hypothetical protein
MRRRRRRDDRFTLTDIARYLRRRTGYLRRVAEAAGVQLLPVTATRHGRGDVDSRPRATARRDWRLLTPAQATAILQEHYGRIGKKAMRRRAREVDGPLAKLLEW